MPGVSKCLTRAAMPGGSAKPIPVGAMLVVRYLMEFYDVVRERCSIRAFQPREVAPAVLTRVLKAAVVAPSAGNLQAVEIFVLTERKHRQAVAEAALVQYFLAQAPVVLVFCANPPRSAQRYGERGEQLYSIEDAAIAGTYAMLAATAEGLACVWVGAFREQAVRDALSLPPELVPVALLPLGYAAESPQRTPRRKFSDMVHRL